MFAIEWNISHSMKLCCALPALSFYSILVMYTILGLNPTADQAPAHRAE